MSSVRTCVWPDCPARFPVGQGPSIGGWRAINRFVFCPFHSHGEHALAVLRLSVRGRLLQVGCVCLEWESAQLSTAAEGVQAWQQHVRVLQNGSG
jgi:hypothetical protein